MICEVKSDFTHRCVETQPGTRHDHNALSRHHLEHKQICQLNVMSRGHFKSFHSTFYGEARPLPTTVLIPTPTKPTTDEDQVCFSIDHVRFLPIGGTKEGLAGASAPPSSGIAPPQSNNNIFKTSHALCI